MNQTKRKQPTQPQTANQPAVTPIVAASPGNAAAQDLIRRFQPLIEEDQSQLETIAPLLAGARDLLASATGYGVAELKGAHVPAIRLQTSPALPTWIDDEIDKAGLDASAPELDALRRQAGALESMATTLRQDFSDSLSLADFPVPVADFDAFPGDDAWAPDLTGLSGYISDATWRSKRMRKAEEDMHAYKGTMGDDLGWGYAELMAAASPLGMLQNAEEAQYVVQQIMHTRRTVRRPDDARPGQQLRRVSRRHRPWNRQHSGSSEQPALRATSSRPSAH